MTADFRNTDLSVYLVLDPDLCGGSDGMIETARCAAANGATCVQLRAPTWKKRALVECGRAIHEALAQYGVPLIINDHADVCVAVGAEGLHVGQSDLAPADARAIIGSKRALGLSISFMEELAAVDTDIVDHLGVGPVFSTSTKPDAARALGLEGFEAVTRAAPLPVVAIGSVKANMATDLIIRGAAGLAVVSAICGQADVATATRELCEAVKKARMAYNSLVTQ